MTTIIKRRKGREREELNKIIERTLLLANIKTRSKMVQNIFATKELSAREK